MNILYSLLGFVAKRNNDFKNHSINSFRVSWAVFLFLFISLNYFISTFIASGTILWLILSILFSFITILMIMTTLLKYIIFQPLDIKISPSSLKNLKQIKEIIVSGTFYHLYEKKYIAFSCTTIRQNKEKTFLFSIPYNSTNYLESMEEENHPVSWGTVLNLDDIVEIKAGNIYYGISPVASVRIKYRDSFNSGKVKKLFLSFIYEEDIDIIENGHM